MCVYIYIYIYTRTGGPGERGRPAHGRPAPIGGPAKPGGPTLYSIQYIVYSIIVYRVRLFTDGIGTPDPDPSNSVTWHF